MSSPSLALSVSETNPSSVEATNILDMENVLKTQLTKINIRVLHFYLMKMLRQIKKTQSEKQMKKTWMLRYNFGVTPPMNPPIIVSHDY